MPFLKAPSPNLAPSTPTDNPSFWDKHPLLTSRIFPEAYAEKSRLAHQQAELDLRKEESKRQEKKALDDARKADDDHTKAIQDRKDVALRAMGAGGTTNAKDTIELLKGAPNTEFSPAANAVEGRLASTQYTGFGVPIGGDVPQKSVNKTVLPAVTAQAAHPDQLTYKGTPDQQQLEVLAKQIESSDDPMAKTVAAAVRAGDKSAISLLKQKETSFQFEKDFSVPGHPGAIVSFDPKANKLIAQNADGSPIANATFQRVAAPVSDSVLAERERRAAEAGEKKGNVKSLADAIEGGRQSPPPLSSRGQNVELFAELERRGFDVRQAQLDFQGALASVKSLNGPQQVRVGQNIRNTAHSLDKIDELADKWNSKGWGILSRANLQNAQEGAYGTEAQKTASALTAQIADVTSELAGVYSGGNASTKEHLALAGQNLQAWWANDTIHDMTKLARYNLNTRKTAMSETAAVTSGGNSGSTDEKPARMTAKNKAGDVLYSDDGGKTWHK